ncbi:MAG TPA: glycosyltransferase family 4 protein [Caldilineaceae bacterium]|nr:glycosyltransferase family 4 protein [Caldilineaceae bacterium]
MKICHVVPFYYPQYAAPYEYTHILARQGYTVDVIALRRPHEQVKEQSGDLAILRVDKNSVGRVAGILHWPLIQTVLAKVQKTRYDIVHVYAFRGSGLLPLFGKRYTPNWILDIRTGNVSKNSLVASIADGVTAIESQSYATHIALDERVGHKVLGKRDVFHVVPVGADMQKFRPGDKMALRTKLGIPQGAQIAIYVGSLNAWRRPRFMLQAFANAAREQPNLCLMILGDDDAMEDLRAHAAELNISNQVLLLGYKPYEEIPEYIAASDIGFAYVPNIPQFRYQPPLKTAEFLACGLPTVATDTEGNAYFVQHEENGLLVPDSLDALGMALRRLAEDQTLYAKLAQQARSSVMHHDWTHIVQTKLIPIYQALAT